MADNQNDAGQDFFQWLPTALTASVLSDIKKSYAQINVLLIKSKVLSQPLTDITSVDEVKFALQHTKRIFANRRLRYSATQILAAYISYAAKTASFDKVVLDALNVNEFDFVSVAARWETLNDFQKNLVWLWYTEIYPPVYSEPRGL